ncbi:Lysosomal beta glucosidase [Phytophthora nicotianae]|uniref:Lysosomal beta glucosidase n=1 Tax=Phytophthora nicotianae TaxID=4792 RepID=A0A0W8CYH0_PHYNI|nr:Lysosomal beta glucosidase [Phytophthora nicotianae]
MPGFKASILEGHNTSRSRVVNNLRVLENVDVASKSAVLYRVIRAALSRLEADDKSEFKALPAYMELFAQQNAGSRVCCQLDDAGRFFRAFLSIGSVVRAQESLLPVWECDGTHMKTEHYNGITLTLLGKDGNKRIVPVAIGYVHKETTDNYVWFFANCVAGGVSLHDRPTFTDRDKQLKTTEEFVWSYLRRINPISWTVLGNSSLDPGEVKWLDDNWKGAESYGDSLPLYGVRSTSGAEGDNNGLLWTGARNNLLFRALRAYCLRALTTRNALLKEANAWMAQELDVTPHAKKLFDDEKRHVAKLTVVQSNLSCFYVFDPFERSNVASSTTMFETNMANGKCRPCRVEEQLNIPCRHIQAVLYELERQNPGRIPVYNTLQYFHSAYLVRTVHDTFAGIDINLPVDSISTDNFTVLPAPLYRQAGGSKKTRVADTQRGEKRMRSRGEEPKCSRSQRNGLILARTDSIAVDAYDDSVAIDAFFQSRVRAAVQSQRAEYNCSMCGSAGHNASTCTFTGQDIEEAGTGIRPGVYILGESPLQHCGILQTDPN